MRAHGWNTDIISGGRPYWTSLPPSSSSVFSQDGRFVVVFMLHELRVYFLATRQCIRTIPISMKGVIQGQLDPHNGNQILLFKDSGEILSVNWKDRAPSSSSSSSSSSSAPINHHPQVTSCGLISIDSASNNENGPTSSNSNLLTVIPTDEVASDSYYVIMGKRNNSAKASPHTRSIYLFDRTLNLTELLIEVKNSIKYAVSTNNRKVAFVLTSNEVALYDLHRKLLETIQFPYKTSITSVAVSNNSVVALGTSSGAIQILYGDLDAQDFNLSSHESSNSNGNSNSTRRPQRLLKWHIDQVKSLQFTPDNSYLLSGGMEKVLVFWQLDTDKTQFLPRLNGSIERISIDTAKSDFYTLLLSLPVITSESFENSNSESVDELESNNEVLIISAVDLASRLSVNGVRPKFALSAINSSLSKTNKRFHKLGDSFDKSKLRHDYTSVFEVHPKTHFLYFPRGGSIQVYDPIRNEQVFTQHAASVLQMGKVRSETKLIDPNVSLVSFTSNGEWMCTFDSIASSKVDNLLSKNDNQYSLKFWKYVDNMAGKNPFWELSSKIIDPHGPGNEVISICSAPVNYHGGLAFITADSKGGLRIWRPRIPKEIYQKLQPLQTSTNQVQSLNIKLQQTAWTLRKIKTSGALSSPAVSVAWSDDGSLILLGHESTITTLNSHTFEETNFQVPSLSGSRIRYLEIFGPYLVVLSKTRITTYNLLLGEFTPLTAKINSPIGGANLIAVDKAQNQIGLALNFYDEVDNELQVKAKILVFEPNSLTPIYSTIHNQGVSSIRKYKSGFAFIDLDSRVGHISYSSGELENDVEVSEITKDMSKMLESAKAEAEIAVNRSITSSSNIDDQMDVDSNDEESATDFKKMLDLNNLAPIFENISANEHIESIFDKIISTIN